MNTDRIETIQRTTAYPESRSVQQALLQVWNECGREEATLQELIDQSFEREQKLIREHKELRHLLNQVYESDKKFLSQLSLGKEIEHILKITS